MNNLYGDRWALSFDAGRLDQPRVRKSREDSHLVQGTRAEIAPQFHAEAQRRIAEGYAFVYFGMRIVGVPPLERSRSSELEAAARGNDNAMLRYAEWLSSRGDTRGDIMTADPNSFVDRGIKPFEWLATDEAHQAWSRVAGHWRQLLGELLSEHSAQLYRFGLGWRLGHLTKIEVAPEDGTDLVPSTAELLARIREHPVACFLD
ncbi:MAG: hypothetical protein HOV81_45415 [Kofleriaceae bacterium]|nr:hypothetical protein [Kofleriaceae bacterium]